MVCHFPLKLQHNKNTNQCFFYWKKSPFDFLPKLWLSQMATHSFFRSKCDTLNSLKFWLINHCSFSNLPFTQCSAQNIMHLWLTHRITTHRNFRSNATQLNFPLKIWLTPFSTHIFFPLVFNVFSYSAMATFFLTNKLSVTLCSRYLK